MRYVFGVVENNNTIDMDRIEIQNMTRDLIFFEMTTKTIPCSYLGT